MLHKKQQNPKQINLDIKNLKDDDEVDQLIAARCSAPEIKPDFVLENQVAQPKDYNRFRDLKVKQRYREKLRANLRLAFEKSQFTSEEVSSLLKQFDDLAALLDQQGAAIFGNMVQIENFQKLVEMYGAKLTSDGSKSWIHSYINFGNHPDFLTNQEFKNAFVHPLLLALISYSAGGPIRIVDARGKDAEPLAVQAQDNMLHIDNTPFRKEYKIIVTWERGKASGPKGQNFVFIPGTHKAVRNCKVNSDGTAWSTEDGSIFITEGAVQTIFDIQKQILGTEASVVEVSHPDMPLTTVFEAGALVHHRYRTKEQNVPRSCIIAAFHRAQDNPGQFLDAKHLDSVAEKGSLLHLLMGRHSENTDDAFINALCHESKNIASKLVELTHADDPKSTKAVTFTNRSLQVGELDSWKKTVTSAPTVEKIKAKTNYFNLGDSLSLNLVGEMMKFDKHGPLDLILYADGHEEIRKWARNRIREMPLARLEKRIQKFDEEGVFTAPTKQQLLTPDLLQTLTERMVEFIDGLSESEKQKAFLDVNEKITAIDAYRSLRQLLLDLGEAIVRCTSRQTFLSTSLFIMLASDELIRLQVGYDHDAPEGLRPIRHALLGNYLSTYVLVEKQIAKELAEERAQLLDTAPPEPKSDEVEDFHQFRLFQMKTELEKAKLVESIPESERASLIRSISRLPKPPTDVPNYGQGSEGKATTPSLSKKKQTDRS